MIEPSNIKKVFKRIEAEEYAFRTYLKIMPMKMSWMSRINRY